MKAILVVAARPNFIKIKPILDGLEALGVECVLVHTGQHYDSNLSDVFFDELGIRAPDENLEVGSGSHAEQTGQVMMAFEKVHEKHKPDATVVVGDVNSTLSCALVAAKAGSLVVHVEAGLRSRDWAMPEEINRVVADRVSDLLFAPSQGAVDNLDAEGYRADQIHLIGNVMIDSLMDNISRAQAQPVIIDMGLSNKGYGLVTLHRPSNVDHCNTLRSIVEAFNVIAEKLPLVFPVHPRTRSKLDELNLHPNITLVGPLGYLDFIALQESARLVMTDSGGVQEETTVLGTPCLTLRESTERPVTVEEGTNRVVGIDGPTIVQVALEVLENPPPARKPALWDGKAGMRCAKIIVQRLQGNEKRRPTSL